MDYRDIVKLLLQSNMDNKIVRIYENSGNKYQGIVTVVKFNSNRFIEKTDYYEMQLENGEECLLLIEEVSEIEIVGEGNQ